ncbi:Thioredoxin domain-containing protein 4 [Operophtera brumata]|uniref:Thioredoxin domain-containing protein 4 n=1 Tax=Operophtera brumata TaxID=104452 RepID=A0A0L7KYH3_OPEBR|nr:Thioredoxin domain-containing protein 4 [Operophtera brumata]
MVLASNEIVFLNFYADWCKFSNMLMPIFDDASDEVTKAGYDTGKVVMGKVDCDAEAAIATRFHITKYPTLKLFHNGLPAKKEYRGQRSVEAFADFIKQQLVDPIKVFGTLKELLEISDEKRHIIGYMDRRDQPEYQTLRRVASTLKDECLFHAGFGDASQQMHPAEPDETYTGSLNNFDELQKWVQQKCIPLVREITFENAEEFTEEGLPFLILFHHPTDTESVKKYKELIIRELESEKQNINFLTADGLRFEHPLHHLGKSTSDLPLIAIDSFRHMEFHYGPDPNQIEQKSDFKVTTPPESTFKKLAPSKNRYTLLRDEL